MLSIKVKKERVIDNIDYSFFFYCYGERRFHVCSGF